MQKLKIDLQKLNGFRTFKSKDGTDFVAFPIEENGVFVGEKGTYLDLAAVEYKDGPKHEWNGFIAKETTKEQREAGIRGDIIGNWKHLGVKPKAAAPKAKSAPPKDDGLSDSDCPF
jgi:hypothetical protein